MGKRKKSTRKPGGGKKNEPLPTTFTCLFCNHEKSVMIKLDKKSMIGSLDCKVCGQHFQCSINYLSAQVDVYGEWVDAADAVAKEDADSVPTRQAGSTYRGTARSTARDRDDEDENLGYEGEGIVADDDNYD